MHRRISIISWLLMVTMSVLVIAIGPACSSCSNAGDYRFTSTVVDGHSHEITLSKADIENPPDQKIIETTSSNGHSHTITLTRADYETFQEGKQITVISSAVDDHTHTFNMGSKLVLDIDDVP